VPVHDNDIDTNRIATMCSKSASASAKHDKLLPGV